MSDVLRLFLVIGAIIVFLFVIRQIRRARLDAKESLFWLCLAVGLVVVALVPGIAYFFSDLLGFQAPSNFVFLVLIALLLVRVFALQADVIALRRKVTALVQEIALRDDPERRR